MKILCVLLFLLGINASPIVVYIGWSVGDIAAGIREAVDAGFNVINLEFWMNNGPADTVASWAALPVATKQATLDYAHSKGAVVIMSVGGGTDHIDVVMTQVTGQTYGTKAAQFAKANLFDGVDLDLEFSPGNNGPLRDGSAVTWIVECHKAVRSIIGSSAYLTHAPQSPYLGDWANKGYITIYKQLNGDIDWFNLQFYNQGDGCYTTYDTLFKSYKSSWDSGNAIAELKAQGIPYEKLVVGKYYPASNGGSGLVEPSVLNSFFQRAKQELGWTGGFMVWGYKCNSGMTLEQLKTWGTLMQGTFGNSLPKKGSGISTGTGVVIPTGTSSGTGTSSNTGSGSSSGTGSGSSGPSGNTAIRCGSSWTTANSACGPNCKSDAECLPYGTKCFADLSLVPCQNIQTATATGTGTGKLTATATSTGTGTGKLTATATSTGTGTGKLTATATSTGTGTGKLTATSTGTGTGKLTATSTGTGTGKLTATATSTGTGTGKLTATSTGTGTGKLTATATSTGTGTGKLTATATSTGTGTGKLTATATSTGTGTGSPKPTNFRCGSSWSIADTTCGTNCITNDDCPQGQTCFAYVSMTPCQGRMMDNNSKNTNAVQFGHQTLAFIGGSVIGVIVVGLVIAVVLLFKPKANPTNYIQM